MGIAAVCECDRIRELLDLSERASELASPELEPHLSKVNRQLETAWTLALAQIDEQTEAQLMGGKVA